eukprot:3263200-Pyramimonas_sp.AAC.1
MPSKHPNNSKSRNILGKSCLPTYFRLLTRLSTVESQSKGSAKSRPSVEDSSPARLPRLTECAHTVGLDTDAWCPQTFVGRIQFSSGQVASQGLHGQLSPLALFQGP